MKKKEKKIIFLIIFNIFLSSLFIISINCIYFIKNKEISNIDVKILDLKKQTKELEQKKGEKINYKILKEIADKNNLSIAKERYVKL